MTPDTVRPWVTLGMAVILIGYGLLTPDPTVLMCGSTMLGAEPMIRAKKEPPP